MSSLSVVPAHLKRFVVRQDYEQYTEEDQAVWRFVVLETHETLLRTAHAAYALGFEAAGISVDRIPDIERMSDHLGRFGWSAVPVDGFIPPRAFQAFQAEGILPVAADIRSSSHLTYTPAPDIIHEAAGHAPFLAEPHYGNYVRRFGGVAANVFTVPSDRRLYDAIYTLSEVKENPGTTTAQLARAEQAVVRATAAITVSSESARLARLYWWTAEYGLVGTPTDFRLYGAGLLSSIGEGYSCRDSKIEKVPLSAACLDADYDITRTQPRLFVARDLSELDHVLDEATASLAYRVGGTYALERARESEEPATVVLDSGAEIAGTVTRVVVEDGNVELVEMSGPCALSEDGVVRDALPRPDRYVVPLGACSDGTELSRLTPSALRARIRDGRLQLTLRSGIEIRGHVSSLPSTDDRLRFLAFDDFELSRGDEISFRSESPYVLALGARVETARAALPVGFFPPTPLSSISVPRPRTFDAAQRELIALFERGREACRKHVGSNAAREFLRITERLDEAYPDEWLLRWNILESLAKLGERSALTSRLETDLERLEIRFDHLEPIATGLASIRALFAEPREPSLTDPRER